ncbi:hypothetical protein OROMI_005570 [Orobanche minor]
MSRKSTTDPSATSSSGTAPSVPQAPLMSQDYKLAKRTSLESFQEVIRKIRQNKQQQPPIEEVIESEVEMFRAEWIFKVRKEGSEELPSDDLRSLHYFVHLKLALRRGESRIYRDLKAHTNLRSIVDSFFAMEVKHLPAIVDFSKELEQFNNESLLEHLGRIRQLGRGGFGTVYLCNIPTINALHLPEGEYAVKIFHDNLSAHSSYYAELGALTTMRFETNTQLIGSGKIEQGLHCIVTSYADLMGRLRDDSNLMNRDEIIRIFEDSAYALQLVHSSRLDGYIVHRDIRLENIFIHQGRALLGDFGGESLEGNESRVWSEIYSDRNRYYHKKTDIYGLGVCMLLVILGKDFMEILAGKFIPDWDLYFEDRGEQDLSNLIDGGFTLDEARSFLRLALRCVSKVRETRPYAYALYDELQAIRKDEVEC